MPSIDTLEFIRLDWPRSTQGESLRDITKPGTDGVAYQAIGKRSQPTQARTIRDVADQSAVEPFHQQCVSLKGAIVSVVTDMNETVNFVAVLDVSMLTHRKHITPVGGIEAGTVLIEHRWILQETKVVT